MLHRAARAASVGLLVLTACPVAEAPAVRHSAGELAGIDRICPGDPAGDCDWTSESELLVGAAALPITPTRWEAWTDVDGNAEYRSGLDTFLDCGGDRLCPGDPGWTAADEGEGDGRFQAMWLAGFQNARPMNGVQDDLWARVTVLRQGETTVAVVALDIVGLFYNEVEEIRASATVHGVDHVIVVSTHVHEAPDTMGLWGPQVAISGVNTDWLADIHLRVDEAIAQAVAEAVPAEVYIGGERFDDDEWGGRGINSVNMDHRDPNIVDKQLWTARFEATGSGETIATWINWPNHPEATSDHNNLVTSDFAHTLREGVEQGLGEGPAGPLPGAGGVAVYLQGACGGMMTPLGATTRDLDGTDVSGAGIDHAYAVGRVVAYEALMAIAAEQPMVEPPRLGFRTRQVYPLVVNRGYWIMINAGIFDRPAYDYDPDTIISEGNEPTLRTEVSLLQLGELSAATAPGEVLPELLVGGYDGAHTGPSQVLVDPNNPNPPDLSAPPTTEPLRDAIPGEVRMLFGLANDELGYIIPEFLFETHPNNPYLDEAEGDHYEETNSVGPHMEREVIGALRDLMANEPPALGP